MNLTREFRLKASAVTRRKEAHQGDAAEPCRRTPLTPGEPEMEGQVVSDVIAG